MPRTVQQFIIAFTVSCLSARLAQSRDSFTCLIPRGGLFLPRDARNPIIVGVCRAAAKRRLTRARAHYLRGEIVTPCDKTARGNKCHFAFHCSHLERAKLESPRGLVTRDPKSGKSRAKLRSCNSHSPSRARVNAERFHLKIHVKIHIDGWLPSVRSRIDWRTRARRCARNSNVKLDSYYRRTRF